jgi:hypothetical protein
VSGGRDWLVLAREAKFSSRAGGVSAQSFGRDETDRKGESEPALTLLRYTAASGTFVSNSDAGCEMFCSTRLMVLSVGWLARWSTRAALLMVWQSWKRFGISRLAAYTSEERRVGLLGLKHFAIGVDG